MNHDQDSGRRMSYCGNDTYGQIRAKYIAAYSHMLSSYELEQSHRKWRQLGKLAKANRLGGVPTQG